MKRLISIILILCMSLTNFSGCKGKNENSDAELSAVFEISTLLKMPDINISIPNDFEETSTDSNEKVFIRNDASIIINSDAFTEKYPTLEEYVNYAIETYENVADETEIINRKKITCAGTDAELIEFIYKINTDNGVFSKYCMVVFFTDGNKIFLATFKADDDKYKHYTDEFYSIIDSISFKTKNN